MLPLLLGTLFNIDFFMLSMLTILLIPTRAPKKQIFVGNVVPSSSRTNLVKGKAWTFSESGIDSLFIRDESEIWQQGYQEESLKGQRYLFYWQ